MKWTTANVKNPNYTENHEFYVGTHTGSFKKLMPACVEKPFGQENLKELKELDTSSRISALSFGNEEKSEILIGRTGPSVELYSLRSELFSSIDFKTEQMGGSTNVMDAARYGDQLIVGLANGDIHSTLINTAADDVETTNSNFHFSAGDDIAHLRQDPISRTLVATGGKGRKNNLKVFDIEAGGKQVFSSKNLPHDYLQLEVPVWDSDIGFMESSHILATCSRYGYIRIYDTRKQRRPTQCFAAKDQMSFVTLTACGNYIYTGTTMGALKAFDIRSMKNFVHTYKGFTGGITDVQLDTTGKYLASASLDRYVRLHHVDSCVLLYQCYVKSKALRVLVRESMKNPNTELEDITELEDQEGQLVEGKHRKHRNHVSDDEEYNEIFEKMQTVCESDVGDVLKRKMITDSSKLKTAGKRKKDIKSEKKTKRHT